MDRWILTVLFDFKTVFTVNYRNITSIKDVLDVFYCVSCFSLRFIGHNIVLVQTISWTWLQQTWSPTGENFNPTDTRFKILVTYDCHFDIRSPYFNNTYVYMKTRCQRELNRTRNDFSRADKGSFLRLLPIFRSHEPVCKYSVRT